jgi:hypothetical protein
MVSVSVLAALFNEILASQSVMKSAHAGEAPTASAISVSRITSHGLCRRSENEEFNI